METQTTLQEAQTVLAPWAARVNEPEKNRLDVYLTAEGIVDAVKAMLASGSWHLSAITGLDVVQQGDVDGKIEVLYHFCMGASIVTLRVEVMYGEPTLPSICGVMPAATLYERELGEMFGVIFDGTPTRDRLLLSDDWPDFVYPMRKSFTGLE